MIARPQLDKWINFAAYEAVWFVTVYYAGHDRILPGMLAAAAFVGIQLAVSGQRTSDVRLIAAALVIGILIDGTLAETGIVRYRAALPAFPPGGAPVWILALWAEFALILNHSLSWLRGRLLVGALLGAVGGPLAYMSSSRMSGAVEFVSPVWHAVVCLAIFWSIAAGLLVYLAARWTRRTAPSPAVARQVLP